MKNRFNFMLLWVFAALTAVSFTSCVGDQFDEIVPDDPATRAPIVADLSCRLNGVEVTSDCLVVGLKYEFMASYSSGACPNPDLRIYMHDESGSMSGFEVVDEFGKGHFSARFIKPGTYRVSVHVVNSVTQDNFGKVYQVNFDEELKMQIDGRVVLGEPFGLYVNLEHPDYPNANLRLAVTELAFNDPQYTMTQVSPGYYEIVLKQPGAYRFTGSVENRGADAANIQYVFHIDRFYRPKLECVSKPFGMPFMATSFSGGIILDDLYANYLRRPIESWPENGFPVQALNPPLQYRFCCNYKEMELNLIVVQPEPLDDYVVKDIVEKPFIPIKNPYLFDIKVAADERKIELPMTVGPVLSRVYVDGIDQNFPIAHYWKLYLPQDKIMNLTFDPRFIVEIKDPLIGVKPVY